MQLGEFETHLHAELGIQVGQGFVEQEDLGFADDRPADGDPLALAAGELLGLALEQLVETENFRCSADTLLPLGAGQLGHAQRETHVLGDGHMGIERVGLEHHGHTAFRRRDPLHGLAVDGDLPLGKPLQSADQPEDG
jgi:hypothetical protein